MKLINCGQTAIVKFKVFSHHSKIFSKYPFAQGVLILHEYCKANDKQDILGVYSLNQATLYFEQRRLVLAEEH